LVKSFAGRWFVGIFWSFVQGDCTKVYPLTQGELQTWLH
jgi:hypothetical protein